MTLAIFSPSDATVNPVHHAISEEIHAQNRAGDIIPSVPVERIVALRESGVEDFMKGIALLQAAQKKFMEAAGRDWFSGMGNIVQTALSGSAGEKEAGQARRQVCSAADRDIWVKLMRDTGMFTLMSGKQRTQWDTELYSDDCPELTLDNVLATFRELNASKDKTFELGVIDVFRSLSWDYKTNNPRYLGKRIIINGVVSDFQGKIFSVRTDGQNKINDLARPFWVLDKKTVPDFRVSEGAKLSDFIQHGGSDSLGEVLTCDYFTIRPFKKGSAHITFTRPELVDRVNDIIARHYPGALPPA